MGIVMNFPTLSRTVSPFSRTEHPNTQQLADFNLIVSEGYHLVNAYSTFGWYEDLYYATSYGNICKVAPFSINRYDGFYYTGLFYLALIAYKSTLEYVIAEYHSDYPVFNRNRWDDFIPTFLFSSDYLYDSGDDAKNALLGKYPITYRLTNCTANDAPTEATVGDTVNVPFTFPNNYGFPNPSTDVYVTNNGVLIPSTYANGTLTFTMPDPS